MTTARRRRLSAARARRRRRRRGAAILRARTRSTSAPSTAKARGPDEAKHEFADVPPAGMAYREMWLLGFFDGAGALIGVATIVGDFLVDTSGTSASSSSRRRCTAAASRTRSIAGSSAGWSSRARGGCASASSRAASRAERFWQRCGYVQVRERGPVTMGKKSNLLRVMAKPLGGGTIDEYLGAGRARSSRRAVSACRLRAASIAAFERSTRYSRPCIALRSPHRVATSSRRRPGSALRARTLVALLLAASAASQPPPRSPSPPPPA